MDVRFRLDARTAHAGRLTALHVLTSRATIEHVVGAFSVISSISAMATSTVSMVVPIALVLLVGVEISPVDRFDVLPERARIGVTLGTSWSFADVRFLEMVLNRR